MQKNLTQNYFYFISLSLLSFLFSIKFLLTSLTFYKFLNTKSLYNSSLFGICLSFYLFDLKSTLYNIFIIISYFSLINYDFIIKKIMKYYEDFNEFIEFSNQNKLNNKYINKFTEYKNKVLNYFNFYKNLLLSTTYFNIIQNLFDKIYKMLLLIDYQYYIEIFNNKFQIIIEFIITYLDNIVL